MIQRSHVDAELCRNLLEEFRIDVKYRIQIYEFNDAVRMCAWPAWSAHPLPPNGRPQSRAWNLQGVEELANVFHARRRVVAAGLLLQIGRVHAG